MRDSSLWSNHAYQPIPRACIVCGERAVAGRSRCSRHGPKAPARTGPNPYDWAHQQERKRRIQAGEGCARYYLGDCHGPLHLDHIIPRSMGGTDDDSNLQILCEYHNISKGGRNRLR